MAAKMAAWLKKLKLRKRIGYYNQFIHLLPCVCIKNIAHFIQSWSLTRYGIVQRSFAPILCCRPLAGRITCYTPSVRPSARPSVRLSCAHCPPYNTERSPTSEVTGRAIFRSKGQRSTSLEAEKWRARYCVGASLVKLLRAWCVISQENPPDETA